MLFRGNPEQHDHRTRFHLPQGAWFVGKSVSNLLQTKQRARRYRKELTTETPAIPRRCLRCSEPLPGPRKLRQTCTHCQLVNTPRLRARYRTLDPKGVRAERTLKVMIVLGTAALWTGIGWLALIFGGIGWILASRTTDRFV